MALITCPECGRQISDRASFCVGCGIPMEDIRQILLKQQADSEKNGADHIAAERKTTSNADIHKTKQEVGNIQIRCLICGKSFTASDSVCPDCKFPALHLSGIRPDQAIINSYKVEKGFYHPDNNQAAHSYSANNGAQSAQKNTDLPPSRKIIGIDFGTTNSRVSVIKGGKPVLISNKEGSFSTPSVVAFSKAGEILVGQAAKRQIITNPNRTVTSIRRYLGNDFNISVDGKQYGAEEIASLILSQLKADAESYLGERVTQAVVTCPELFTFAQKQALQEAGRRAGLNVKRIINDPSATALAYGLDKSNDSQKILIYDLGGGTLDVSVIEIGDGVVEVLAANGDNHLGGEDFDNELMNYLIDSFRREHGVDLRKDKMAVQRLKDISESAKKDLSVMQTARINLPFISADQNGPLHMDMEISRTTFESLVRPLIDRAIAPIQKVLNDAGITAADIDKVILTGGSTRIPSIQEAVRRATGKELFKGINPDECVAKGAGIQAGILSGEVTGIFVMDVMPLSLSIETLGGVATKVIDRNTSIPTKKSMIFSTAADNQIGVDIHVLQGESEMANENTSLGKFQLSGIPPAKRGIPQIEVTFEVDANGMIRVSAKDLGSGKEQKITVSSSVKR